MSELEVNESRRRKIWLTSINPTVLGFSIVIAIVGFYSGLGWLDNTTELWPRHDDSIAACFWLGGIAALLIGITLALRLKDPSVWMRIRVILPLSLIGAIGVALLSLRLVDFYYGWIDFPSQKTQTFQGLLQISRAYQTHGKGASRDIQTTPIWSDMKVTNDDYEFMLNHRRPGDLSKDSDEISSKGYFCAKVTAQRSGDALRVLHAGSGALPSGTVIICPQATISGPN